LERVNTKNLSYARGLMKNIESEVYERNILLTRKKSPAGIAGDSTVSFILNI
jgi:hypothetical protein